MPQFLAVGTVNYLYKMSAAIALIPLLYVAVADDRALPGQAVTAEAMREDAAR